MYIYIRKSYLWSAELYEGRSSHLRTELLQLQKESRKENSGLYTIRTPYFCDTSAPLYQLSYQPNWEHYICWFSLPNLWPLCLSQGLLNIGQTPTSNWEPCAQNLSFETNSILFKNLHYTPEVHTTTGLWILMLIQIWTWKS